PTYRFSWLTLANLTSGHRATPDHQACTGGQDAGGPDAGGSCGSTTRAPGTGPCTTLTFQQTPIPASSVATSRAACASLHRNAQVGPEPDTIPASAPA